MDGGGAPASLRPGLLLLFAALLAAAGCTQARQGEETAQPQPRVEVPAPPAEQQLPERFARVSVYLTDARTNDPVADAEVFIGAEPLPGTSLPKEYDENPAGLYTTDALEGGIYLFRAKRAGYRSLAGRLAVPPVPERITVDQVPTTLEPEGVLESGEAGPSLRALVLWKAYRRIPEGEQGTSHPPMPRPPGASPHGPMTTHPLGAPPPSPDTRQ